MSGKQSKSFFFCNLWIVAILILSLAMIFAGCDSGGGNATEYTVTFERGEHSEWSDIENNPTTIDVVITSSTVGISNMPPNPTREGYTFEGWVDIDGAPFDADTPVIANITVYAKWELDLPSLEGTASIDCTSYRIGQTLTVNLSITTEIEIPSYKYQWQADEIDIDEANEETYVITGADAGKTITCVITHEGYKNKVIAEGEKVPFEIELIVNGQELTDAITVDPDFGHIGETITLSYMLENIKINNQLTFIGVSELTEQLITVTGATENVEGTLTFTIDKSDAVEGKITVTADFAHSDKIIETIVFANANETKIYGDEPFTYTVSSHNNPTERPVKYESEHDDIASVNENTGVVTIKKVGHTRINATKEATDTHDAAHTFYELTVNPKLLTITGTEVVKSKEQVEGNTNATVTTVGTLVGKVGADNVTVSAVATYDNDNVGTGKTITVVFTLDGTDKANYHAPENIIYHDGAITPAPSRNINIKLGTTDHEVHLSAVGGTFTVISDNAYEFTATGGYGNAYVISEINFPVGSNIAKYEKVTFTYKGVSGDGGFKDIALLVSNNTFSGNQGVDNTLSFGKIANGVGNTGTANLTINISSSKADAVKGNDKLYVSLFMPCNNPTVYQISNINFILKPIAPATVTPVNAIFDLNEEATANNDDITFTITQNDWSAFTSVKNLTLNTDYTVSGNYVTVKKEFLLKQEEGDLKLAFVFGAGEEVEVTIKIADSTGGGEIIVPSAYKTSYDFAVDTNISDLIRTTSTSAVSANISEGHLNFVLVAGYTQEQVVVRFDLGNTTLADYNQIVITKSPATHTGSGTDWNNKPLNAKAMIAAETGAPSTAITAASGNLNFGNNASITLTINGGGTLTGLVDIGFSTQNFPAGYTLRFSSITLVPK
ncbi:MAG: InlB B-repeat-containing protein [Treponema sp.]|nr:InlB B-repeat-containing protein [Treponema sp.]MCL2252031.1 InlB B-repeat-containing protein [Treponema sp.]